MHSRRTVGLRPALSAQGQAYPEAAKGKPRLSHKTLINAGNPPPDKSPMGWKHGLSSQMRVAGVATRAYIGSPTGVQLWPSASAEPLGGPEHTCPLEGCAAPEDNTPSEEGGRL